jgi:transitional endoplasmic reticulum ATPase
MVSVGVPDLEARKDILKVHTRKKPLAADVDLTEVAKKTEGYTGADLFAVVNEAVMMAIREVVAKGEDITPERMNGMVITRLHFDTALINYIPRSKAEAKKFEKLVKDFEYVR